MTKTKQSAEFEALPEDFDPMEMAAFLDGESNTDLVKGLTQSSALRAVAAAGLDTAQIADVEAAQALAERASPLVRPAGSVAVERGGGLLSRLSNWVGGDWRGVTAGLVLGVFGFSAGLFGGLGLGDIGISTDDILISASASEVFAFNSAADSSVIDPFDAVFGSFE